ncbi:MAG: pyridoxamine 5'-phosphate oxidase family protein [Loktanella sp.]|nr:pyridoxamine 5'-phosphate oxidase family protein [Loktanella sp.]
MDAAGKRLWFLTKDDTDLAKALQPDSTAHFVIISKDHDFYACMSGPISQQHDTAILDALWNTTLAQMFADDKNDPSLMMIALDLKDAAIWALSEDVSHHSMHIKAKSAQDVHTRKHVKFD